MKLYILLTNYIMYFTAGLGISLHLEKEELINLSDDSGAESTCKYTIEQIRDLVEAGQLILERSWIDQDSHIALCCLRKKNNHC